MGMMEQLPNLARIFSTPAGISAAMLTVFTPSGVVTRIQSEAQEIEHNSMSRTRTRIRTSVALEIMQIL